MTFSKASIWLFFSLQYCEIWKAKLSIEPEHNDFQDKSPYAFGANFQVPGVKHQQCVGFLLTKRFATENATLKRRRKEGRKKERNVLVPLQYKYKCFHLIIFGLLSPETAHPLHHFPVVPPPRWLLVRCAQTTFLFGRNEWVSTGRKMNPWNQIFFSGDFDTASVASSYFVSRMIRVIAHAHAHVNKWGYISTNLQF